MTLMDSAFLSLYVNILLIVVFTTLTFYFRSKKLNHERIVSLGKLISPSILILTIILLIPTARIEQTSDSEGQGNMQMQFKEWHP